MIEDCCLAGNGLSPAARTDHPGIFANFLLDPCHHALDETGIPKDDARLHCHRRVSTNRLTGCRTQLDATETCRALDEGFGGSTYSRRNCATEVVALTRDGIEHRGGAEVYPDQ